MNAVKKCAVVVVVGWLVVLANGAAVWAQEGQAASGSESQREQIVAKGLEFLKTKGQGEDGLFTGKVGPGVTALALTGRFAMA